MGQGYTILLYNHAIQYAIQNAVQNAVQNAIQNAIQYHGTQSGILSKYET